MRFNTTLIGAFLLIMPLLFHGQQTNKDSLRFDYAKKFTVLLTKQYLIKRQTLSLSPALQKKLQELQSNYNHHIKRLGNPKNEHTSIYPNISAVLLSKSSLSSEEIKQNSVLVTDLWKGMPNAVFAQVATYTEKIKKDQFHLTFPYRYEIFDDLIDSSPRQRDQVLNFLLWTL